VNAVQLEPQGPEVNGATSLEDARNLPAPEQTAFSAYAVNNDGVAFLTPTESIYAALEESFSFLNERLFVPILGFRVPPCILTLEPYKRAYGFFAGAHFVSRDGGVFVDKIALNPQRFLTDPIVEVPKTMGHEMMHSAQHHFGMPSERHHNRQYAEWSRRIGLPTSHTGKPGGKLIGRNMSNYVEPGGPFDLEVAELLAGNWGINWGAVAPPERAAKSSPNKVAYPCQQCGVVLWGEAKHRAVELYPSCIHCR
jgi:hypothetical protein